MSNRRRRPRQKEPQMDNHQAPPAQRQPRAQTIIDVQRARLAEKDDQISALAALVNDYQNDCAGLTGMLDQVVAENRVRRKRLGIAPGEAIEVDDVGDAAEIAGAVVRDDAGLPEMPIDEAKTIGQEDAAHHHA